MCGLGPQVDQDARQACKIHRQAGWKVECDWGPIVPGMWLGAYCACRVPDALPLQMQQCSASLLGRKSFSRRPAHASYPAPGWSSRPAHLRRRQGLRRMPPRALAGWSQRCRSPCAQPPWRSAGAARSRWPVPAEPAAAAAAPAPVAGRQHWQLHLAAVPPPGRPCCPRPKGHGRGPARLPPALRKTSVSTANRAAAAAAASAHWRRFGMHGILIGSLRPPRTLSRPRCTSTDTPESSWCPVARHSSQLAQGTALPRLMVALKCNANADERARPRSRSCSSKCGRAGLASRVCTFRGSC